VRTLPTLEVGLQSFSSLSPSRFYVNASSVTIIGQPSATLADKIEKDEKAHVAANVAHYGPAGLAKLAKEIEDAQADNDKPIPPELISKFKVPDVAGIEWIKVESARSAGVAKGADTPSNRVQAHVDADGAELPLFVQFDRKFELGLFASNRKGDGDRLGFSQTSTRTSSRSP
jgi:Zn-dependent M16 (insulinase) family peptidase